MGINIENEVVQKLQAQGVEINTPDSVDIRDLIKDMELRSDGAVVTFQSVEDKEQSIEIANVVDDYVYPPETYCEVTAIEGDERTILYSQADDGKTIGSTSDVEKYFHENMSDGFYEKDAYEPNMEVEIEHPDSIDSGKSSDYEFEADVSLGEEIDINSIAEENIIENQVDDLGINEQTEYIESEKPTSTLENAAEANVDAIPFLKELSTGFIPFELREGYRAKGINDEMKISQQDVAEIREKFDPAFGMVLGVDTSAFVTKSTDTVTQNVSIIRLEPDDVRKYFVDNSRFTDDNIGSVKVYKEFGESINIDRVNFGVTNLATFEVQLKDEDTPLRSTVVIDDSGVIRGVIPCQGTMDPFTFEDDGSSKIDKLDRTNVENRGHFPQFNNRDESFHESFLQKVEQSLPAFYEDFNNKFAVSLDERKELIESRMESLEADKNSLHDILNRVELYREIEGTKVVNAEISLENSAAELKSTIDERKDTEKGTAKYDELTEKIEALKEDFVTDYVKYSEAIKEVEPQSLSEMVENVRGLYEEASLRFSGQEQTVENYFGRNVDYGDGKLQYESFRDGVYNDKPVSEEMRFRILCGIEGVRTDGYPLESKVEALNDTIGEFLMEVDSKVEATVNEYNESVPDVEKIYIGDDKQLYTEAGLKIEAKLLPQTAPTDFPTKEVEDTYNKSMDKEEHDLSKGMENVPNTHG